MCYNKKDVEKRTCFLRKKGRKGEILNSIKHFRNFLTGFEKLIDCVINFLVAYGAYWLMRVIYPVTFDLSTVRALFIIVLFCLIGSFLYNFYNVYMPMRTRKPLFFISRIVLVNMELTVLSIATVWLLREEASKPYIRQAIKDADLITIGIGGNDWGAYLTWIMASVQLENKLPEEFRNELAKFLKNASVDDNMIEKLIEIADYCNALDELATALPEAMSYGVRNMRTNWNYIVEYIYENNPDVTLMAIGMFAGDYKTNKGEPDVIIESDPITSAIENYIVDFGNEHVLLNQEKYGYIFVDTKGTIVEESHPTVAGHRYIADRILEELPDARCDLTDIRAGQANYKAVEYMYINGLMNAAEGKAFNGNAAMTKADFSALMSNYNTAYPASTSTKAVTLAEVKLAAFITAEEKTFNDLFNFLSSFAKLFVTNDAFDPATRMQVAAEFYSYIK